MRIMFSFMGVPEADWAQLKEWCGSRASLAWGRPTPDEALHHAQQMVAYRRYLRELVAAKATDRGDDFASALLEIHDEDPEALTQEEVASILFSLSFAGHETTNNLIGNCVRRLLEVPERWARLVGEPALIPGAVDEMLRFDPSVPVWRRVTKRPVTLGGVDLPEGAKLFLWLAAAGRDADVFPEPERVRSRARQLPPDAGLRARDPLLHRVGARAHGGRAGARGADPPLPGPAPGAAGPGRAVPSEHLLPRPAGAVGGGLTMSSSYAATIEKADR